MLINQFHGKFNLYWTLVITWFLLGQNPVLTQSNLLLLNEHPVNHNHLCRGTQPLLKVTNTQDTNEFRAQKLQTLREVMSEIKWVRFKWYLWFLKKQVTIFIQHSLCALQELAWDILKFIIHWTKNQELNTGPEEGATQLHYRSVDVHTEVWVFTFAVVSRGRSHALIQVVRQQSMKCVLKRVERRTVVRMKNWALLFSQLF